MSDEHTTLDQDVTFLGAVNTDPTSRRPMIAIVQARHDTIEPMRAAIVELVAQVREEPGCEVFIPYESLTEPGHFYLYEVYRDLRAFQLHLATDHVQRFVTTISSLCATWPAYPIQLDEIPVEGVLPGDHRNHFPVRPTKGSPEPATSRFRASHGRG